MSDWLPEPPAAAKTAPDPADAPSLRNLVVTCLCVVVVAMCLTWTFLAMRAVMGVGGSCASGGAYDIATPCPDGSWLMGLGIPVMIIAALAGSGFASTVGAPNLLLPMWGILFGTLGYNFLEFGVRDGPEWGYLVCGVVFEAMAAPALWGIAVAFVNAARKKRQDLGWFATYQFLGACGAFLGVAIYGAAS